MIASERLRLQGSWYLRTLFERHATTVVLSMQVDRFPHDAHRKQRAFVRRALSVLRGCPPWRSPESDGMESGALADGAWSVRADGAARIIAAALSWILSPRA